MRKKLVEPFGKQSLAAPPLVPGHVQGLGDADLADAAGIQGEEVPPAGAEQPVPLSLSVFS